MDIVTQQNKNDKLKLGNITKCKIKLDYGLQYGDGVSQGYTIIQNELVYDFSISAEAFRLFCVMWALPSGYHFSVENYIDYHARKKQERKEMRLQNDKVVAMDKKKVQKLIKELIAAGYLERTKIGYKRINNKTIPDYQYTLYEIPKHIAEIEAETLNRQMINNKADVDIDF